MTKETLKFRKQFAGLKEKLIKDICQYLQAPKPGSFKPRPALYIAPGNFRINIQGYKRPHKITAVMPGYIIIEYRDQFHWICMENLYIEELLKVQRFLDENIQGSTKDGRQLRIIDPFWFITDKANENLKKVLSETREHYIESFSRGNNSFE